MAGSELQAVEAIHAEVRSHYAERAQAAGGSCCGGSSGGSSGGSCCGSGGGSLALYDAADLAALSRDADPASWGCGNPTAIAALQAGEVVLDLGSGGGLDVMLAAAKVGSQGFVYGVDMTDEMLQLARRNAAKTGVTNVEFRQGQIEALPLPDQSVDVILSNCVINLSPDKGKVLREAFRVLRPGGRFAVSDIVVDGSLADLPLSEAQIRTALSWAGCIAGALTMDEYKRLLAAAGFAEIEVEVKHRYTVEELGQDMGGVDAALPLAVAEQLAGRFASCDIRARRPVA